MEIETRATVVDLPRGTLVAFPTLRAAAGWKPSTEAAFDLEADGVRLLGEFDEDDFAVRASGTSMEGWTTEIRDGDWLVMRWARGSSLRAFEDKVALIGRGDPSVGRTFHLKRLRRTEHRLLLFSDNPDVEAIAATAEDEPLAIALRTIRPEELGPEVGVELGTDEIADAFGIDHPPEAPWGRVNGHLFVLAEGEGSLARYDRVGVVVPDRKEAETAFVLARAGGEEKRRYLGVGRWDDESAGWRVPDVDWSTWRALGRGRGASRELEENWGEAAAALVKRLLQDPGPGGWVEARGKRCRVLGRAVKGGLRIDGGQEGFDERTVSLVDLGWVFRARQEAELLSAVVDEALVNRLRYLAGTPKESTRWIDTGWALVLSDPEGSSAA